MRKYVGGEGERLLTYYKHAELKVHVLSEPIYNVCGLIKICKILLLANKTTCIVQMHQESSLMTLSEIKHLHLAPDCLN